MNRPTDPTRPMASRPLTERIATAIRDGLRGRQARTFDDVADLNAHMLKDIGAPSWLVSRARARRDAPYDRIRDAGTTTLAHTGAVRWWPTLVLVVWIAGAAAPSVWGAPAEPAGNGAVRAASEGVFTGQFDRGVPIYRLPSITVSAHRNAEPERSTAQARNAHRVSRVTPLVVTGAGRTPS